MALVLRPLRLADERAFLAAHELCAREAFNFGLGLEPGMSWPDYLTRLADLQAGVNLGGFVPSTFLVADVDGVIVGRTSVRHRLNATLSTYGGHIGYCVLPAHRRLGYAKEILRQSLVVARAAGVDRALLTCDQDNVASRHVIEANGGRLDGEPDGGTLRYWID